VFCLDRAYRKRGTCGRLDVDGWSHHPYTTPAGPFFASPERDDVTIGTLSRLTRALDRAARAGAVRRGLPVWLTEFGVQSSPDRISGVSLTRQVEFRAHAERLAYAQPRVKAFAQYLLTDDLPREGVGARERYGGFESGLRFSTGRAKPSLEGFRLRSRAAQGLAGVGLGARTPRRRPGHRRAARPGPRLALVPPPEDGAHRRARLLHHPDHVPGRPEVPAAVGRHARRAGPRAAALTDVTARRTPVSARLSGRVPAALVAPPR
jgi:hypothetical protein